MSNPLVAAPFLGWMPYLTSGWSMNQQNAFPPRKLCFCPKLLALRITSPWDLLRRLQVTAAPRSHPFILSALIATLRFSLWLFNMANYGKWPTYIGGLRWFTCHKWWFFLATLNNQRVVWVLIHCFIVEGFHPIDWFFAPEHCHEYLGGAVEAETQLDETIIEKLRPRTLELHRWNQVNSLFFRNVSSSCIWCMHTVLGHVYVRMYIYAFLIYIYTNLVIF